LLQFANQTQPVLQLCQYIFNIPRQSRPRPKSTRGRPAFYLVVPLWFV